MGMFGANFHILEAALAARERLQTTHAANIANADTPNYSADTRDFSYFLQEEMQRLGTSTTEHGINIPVRHRQGRYRLDGNSVDMQREITRMTENQLMHELTLRLIKGKLNNLARAIREGGR